MSNRINAPEMRLDEAKQKKIRQLHCFSKLNPNANQIRIDCFETSHGTSKQHILAAVRSNVRDVAVTVEQTIQLPLARIIRLAAGYVWLSMIDASDAPVYVTACLLNSLVRPLTAPCLLNRFSVLKFVDCLVL